MKAFNITIFRERFRTMVVRMYKPGCFYLLLYLFFWSVFTDMFGRKNDGMFISQIRLGAAILVNYLLHDSGSQRANN